MTTSGTFTYNPALFDVVINAFSRIQIRRTELLAEHMSDAATEANLLLTEWANRQVNLWTSTKYSVQITQGMPVITLPTNLITVLAAYVTPPNASGATNDFTLTPISTTEYASYTNKALQSRPSVFWLNRQVIPQMTLFPVPDQTYTLNLQYVRQVQDAGIPGGTQLEVPYRWLDAYTAGLAARLAQIYRPAVVQYLDGKYERAWLLAAGQDTENVPISIVPVLDGYYR